MTQSKEELISDHFVQVELKLNSLVDMCEDSNRPFELAEWIEERRVTLEKFDRMVATAESQDEVAKNILLCALKRTLLRVRFAHKLAVYGIFIVYDGPGKLFPIPGCLLRLFKGGTYQKL